MRRTLLTLLALTGCKDKRPESPPPPPSPRDGVTLIQPGTAPLQVLRYRLTKGTKTTSELVYDFEARSDDQPGAQASGSGGPASGSAQGRTNDQGSGGPSGAGSGSDGSDEDPAEPAPTLIVTLETLVEDVLADGSAKLRMTVVGSRVRDRPGSHVTSDVVRTQAAAADGVVLTQTLAPDGKTSDVHVESAATLPVKARARLDSLIQSLEHVAMQLPAEPVGVGATWRERKPLPEGGIRAVSEATYTLTALTGSTATYMGTGRAISGPQTLEQDGTKVEVTNPRGHSETKGTIDLARFAPAVMSTSTFAAEMSVDAPKGTPGAGTSTVEVTVAIQMAPAGAPGNEPAADLPASSPQPPAPPAGSAQPPAPPAGSEPDQGAHSAP